jgi:dephospho-CoA kinase
VAEITLAFLRRMSGNSQVMITIIFAFIHEIIYFKINDYNLFNNYNLVSVDEQIHNIYAEVRGRRRGGGRR